VIEWLDTRMQCDECGKWMVEENPMIINASDPPSRWMKCKCGNKALLRMMNPKPAPKSFEERWDEANE
jgi:hypothetical protein